ncbi:hypothetical protein BDZ88DRAFT_397137 [Geranomyces variabilis]|nr:hypothetical protein BDZ88DRAFT_397137 [Geranomyces variabilis]
MQKIRVALNIRDAASRRKLLTIRILSIAVLGKSEWSLVGYLGYFEIVNKKGLCLVILGTEELIQSRLFTFEPDLVQRLADILHMESNEGDVFELQAACLHALDSMAHHRSRLGEVLTAVNASANHGILMFILRKAISAMDSDEQKYPLEFVDALFGFVAYIASTQSGGTMIITAGVLPILIELMRNQRPDQLKAVTRCVLLLDSLVFGFTSSFAPFTAANGLDILVNRIQDEVAFCFSFKAENVTSADLPHERISLLRSLLKFVLHMMQTSGSADRMRNLIDTSLPTGILTIFNESMLFGASIFGLAVNIMSTFIHNEPTCLSILQEAHLPQALLAALAKEIPISAEVISALPNAFGAICLNAQGLEQFNEAKPVGKYLELLTSEEHIKTLQDNDVPHLVGNSMDELMRHHPSLKDYVMTSIIDMLKRVVAFGEQVPSDDPESAGLQIMKATPKPTEDDEEKKESRTSQFIDLIARFLEGLFQNVAHCKDFIKMDGVQIMLKCYTLPTLPYDFATSASSYSLSYLFRLMIEANAPQVVGYMLTEIHSALEAAEHFLSFKGPGSLVANYIDLKDEDTERIAEGQRVFRSLITLQGFIRLLSDIYCTHVLSHTKSVLALIQTFSGDIGSTFIARFGAIYRTCVWENLLLKDTVPKQWYETASKKTDKGQLTRGSMASALLDVDVLDSVLEATPTAASTDTAATPVATGSAAADTCSDKDPRILNTRAFRHLLSQIPTVMTPTLQGILKLLTTRRISEVGNRKAGQMIVDDIAAVLRDHFTWERPSQDPSSNKYSYLAVVLGFVSVMFVEERGLHLHMNLAAAFHKTDGTQCIVNAIQKLWDEADALSAEPDKKEDPALTEKRIRISGALELALNVLQTLSNAKLVHDSPLTGPMMSRERDKTSPEYFDPHEYITDVRTRVGPLVLQLWKSDYLKRAPANIVRSILAIVTHITKGEGEVKGEGPPSLAPINVASLFSRHAAPPVVAEEEKIQQLVDMGFPRAAAETALVRCANHVGRAAEYLLMHPNLVATAGYAGASASASSAAPAPAAAATDPAPATVETEPPASPAAPAPESAPAATTNDPMDTSDSEAGDEDPDLAAALAPADKGKGPAPVESALEKLRNELKADIPSRSLELLDNVDEKVIFSIKELFCLVGVSDIPATIKYVGDDIERAREEMVQNPSQANTKRFAVRLRLFTLIVSDAAWQKSGIENSQPLIGCLLQMTSADGISSSSWLPSALLVLESYISLSDEPKSVPFQLPDGTTTNYDHNVDNGVLKRLTTEERLKFMQSLVSLMALDTIDKEMLHAVMRLIVRLTRSHGIAIEFARVGGIPLLFNPNRIGLFHAQPAMTIMILRHIIEDSAILKATMERELVHWFTHPRPRTADIPGFIKAHSHLICRDVDAFLAAATEVCVLPRYEKSILRPTQIAMQQKDAAPDQLKSNYMSDLSEMVVQFLVSELMALKRSSVVSASTTTAGEPSEPDREKLLHLQRCFLLQCLGELVVSYATCKLDVINVSQKRAFKGTPHKGTFGRNPFLNHLVQDLLPQSLITGVAPGDETPERQRAIWDSKWTTCVISALCLGVTSDVAQERAMYPELANVRRCVLDVLARSLRETINHTDIATDLRHSRLMTISELCFRILTARGPGALGTPGPPGSEDIATHLGRTMLEKGFVNLLTQSLAEIDIHHPCSSQLIAAILKPLEFLTKLAIKLGKTGEPKSAQAKSDAASAVVLPNGVVPMEETSAELADMFRNSALGMYNAPTSDEDMDDDSSEDSEDEDGYDEFSDDEDISDPDEMDEDEGSDDEEMELVVPQPYQGNPDPSDDDEEDDEDGEMGSITGGEFVHDDDDDDEDDDPDDDDSETRMSWTAEVRENDHDSEEDDDNQDLLDDEEEDSEDEDGEGSHDIFEEEDFVDDPDNPFLDGHVGGRGNFFVDGRRRARRSARRQIMEVLGRPLGGRPPHAPVDDGMAHPLLVNQAANGSRPNVRGDITAHRGRGGSSGVRAGDVLDWQAFDDLIGGNALQILEQLFYRGDRVAPPQLQHMDVGLSDMGHGMAPGGLVAGIPIGGSRRAPPAASAGEGSSAQRPADAPEPSLIDQQLAFIHAFTPQGTSDRWGQEARLMYGTSAPEKGARATNALVNALMPAAIEAAEKRKELEEKAEKQRQESEKIRREEERKRLEEEAQKQKEEEERLRKEAEEAAAAAAAAATAAAAANPTPEVPAEERVVVTVNGREYDITGSGIDVDFLQALPDDLQQDVIDQHFRDQRRTQQVTEVPTDISSEFLDALPEEIRNEVMAQQRREQERRNRAATSAPSANGFLATLPSALVAEANAFRGQRNRGRLGRMFQTRPPSAAAAAILASLEGIPSKKPAHREAVHLLDRPALLTLIRMLFLPEPVSIALLHRTLVNLCENSKTRVELVSLFLSILADGSTDLAAVDKSFSQLSLKAKGKHAAATPKKGGAAALATPGAPALAHAENVPNLVAQRCLDALSQMIVFNESVARLFLLDTESMGPNFAKTPKKGKGKEKAVEYKYPIVALLSLLHRPAFLNSAPLMERLMHIISMILRLLTFVNGKAKEAKEKAEKAEAKPTANWKPPVIPDQYVSAVVHVLTAGVCTGKSFQYTLTVVQHLFGNPSNRDTITRELADAAQRLGDALVPDLDELTHVLQTASTAVEVQSATLGKFTQSSSQQSKLLRVLKTIDFIHTKGKISEKNTTGSLSSDGETRLLAIYDRLQLPKLWQRLGACLTLINDKEALIHVATVLLPAIESFMVVSKPQPPSLSRSSTGQHTGLIDLNNEDLFVVFTEEHRKILNTMVRNSPSLMSGSFSLLVHNQKVLEFDNKRTYFNLQLHKRTTRDHYGTLQINVRRQYVFEDSYHQLQGRSGDEIKFSKLNVRFYEEEGVDAGGVTREWFSVLARQMFNPDYALFRPSAVDKVTYQPNRLSGINPDHLLYFKFVGRVIGKAIYDGRLLDAYFTRSFYKSLIDAPVDYKDMEAVDPEFHKSLEWILQNDITDVLDLTFSTEIDEFGKKQIIDLKPDGRNLPVTDQNKMEYVKLVVDHRLITAIRVQIEAFLSGFHDVIPRDLVKIFNEQELELLISGMPDIDIDDWKNNTEYQNYTQSSPQVQWFWRAVRSFSQEERAKLVQFATGTSKVPLEGFAELQGSGGVQKFQIHKDFSSPERLPSAHTCFNQLDLPLYESYEQLRSSLLIAISEGATGTLSVCHTSILSGCDALAYKVIFSQASDLCNLLVALYLASFCWALGDIVLVKYLCQFIISRAHLHINVG